MLEAAKRSQLLAHQMIWNMKTNMYTDEEGEHPDPKLFDILSDLIAKIQVSFSWSFLSSLAVNVTSLQSRSNRSRATSWRFSAASLAFSKK